MSAQSPEERAALAAVATPSGARASTVKIDPDAAPPVNPDRLVVKGQCTDILFKLTSAAAKRYRFAQTDPIVVPACGNFPNPPVRVSDTCVSLTDTCDTAGSYKYTINLVKRKTGQPVVIDPTIDNEK